MDSPVVGSCIQYMPRTKRSRKSQRTKQVKTKSKSKPKPINVTELANKVGNMVLRRVAPPPTNNSFLGNLGQWAGNSVSKVFGLGAYRMTANSLWNSATNSQVPFMHSTNESFIFRHREYLGDISSSKAFQSQTFNLNPGLSATFPYISKIAQNFQEYKFRGMVVEYKSTSSVALTGADTSMGTVSLVAQYRADAVPLTTKLSVLNEMWAEDGRPSENILMPVECSPRENPMSIQYVRTGALPANQDVKLYDLAKVSVVTQGQQTTGTTIGELWISVEVELYKPILSVGSQNLNEGAFNCILNNVSSTVPLSSTQSVFLDNIGITISSGPSTVSFPAGSEGTYVVYWSTGSNAGAIVNPTITGNAFATITSLRLSPQNTTISDRMSIIFVVTLKPDSLDDIPVVTFGVGGTIGTGQVGLMYIYQVNSAVV